MDQHVIRLLELVTCGHPIGGRHSGVPNDAVERCNDVGQVVPIGDILSRIVRKCG
jgi:hypothetical protein